MPERIWSVRDKRTGKEARFGEITNRRGTEWAFIWTEIGDGSRFTAEEAIVAVAFAKLFAERFGDKRAVGRFAAVEVAR
jgi:hypothetical protein